MIPPQWQIGAWASRTFVGYARAQAVAEMLPGMARRASAGGDASFASEILDALAGWLSSLQCRAFCRTRRGVAEGGSGGSGSRKWRLKNHEQVENTS